MAGYSTKNYREQGGEKWVVGGELDVTGALKMDGDEMTFRAGIADVTTTVEIETGLATVTSATATLSADPDVGEMTYVTVSIPAQTAGDAGKFTIKGWKPTATDNATPTAGSAEKKVSWFAVGTA